MSVKVKSYDELERAYQSFMCLWLDLFLHPGKDNEKYNLLLYPRVLDNPLVLRFAKRNEKYAKST